jgi:hypothetical protein
MSKFKGRFCKILVAIDGSEQLVGAADYAIGNGKKEKDYVILLLFQFLLASKLKTLSAIFSGLIGFKANSSAP